MIERFTLTNPKNAFQEMKCGINDKDKTLTFNEVVDLLNELNDENKKLIQFKEQVFNLIDKKLEANKELDGVDTAMYYANKQTLNELKKELRE